MIRYYALITLAMCAATGNTETITETNINRANIVIEAAVEAYGGANQIEATKTIIISHETLNAAVGQSLRPGPPWDRNNASGTNAIDLANNVFFTHNYGVGGGFEFDTQTIIDGESSRRIDNRAGTRSPIDNPDFDAVAGPFTRVTPLLLVRQLQQRAQNAYFLGESVVNETVYEVIGFSMAVGPAMSLYFNKSSHLLERAERVLTGFGLVEYEFSDYHNYDEIPFNQTFRLFLNGEENMVRKNSKPRLNASLTSLVKGRSDLALALAPPVVQDALSRREIAEGVFLIGGTGTYALFVELTDHVVAIGGTAGITERIDLLREVVPTKPIKYGVLTHHHNDHVLGVSAYQEANATIIAPDSHEEAVRAASTKEHAVDFLGVSQEHTLKDNERIIKLIDIGPTAHSQHILVAWLPSEKILFQADHFNIPNNRNITPAVSATKSFASALKTHGIKPQHILSAHSPHSGTMKDLTEALEMADKL